MRDRRLGESEPSHGSPTNRPIKKARGEIFRFAGLSSQVAGTGCRIMGSNTSGREERMVRSTNDLSQRYPSSSRRNTMQSPNKQLAIPNAKPIQTMDSNKKYIFPRIYRARPVSFRPTIDVLVKARALPYRVRAAVIEFQRSISLENKQKLLAYTLHDKPPASFLENPRTSDWRKLVTGVGHSARRIHPVNATALSGLWGVSGMNSKRAILAVFRSFPCRNGWSSEAPASNCQG